MKKIIILLLFLFALTASADSFKCSGVQTGNLITWTASSGTYNYMWSGDDGLSGTARVVTKMYATRGVKHAIVQAYNYTTGEMVSDKCQINLKP